MSFFYDLEAADPVQRRIADRLLRLGDKLDAEIPSKTLDDTLLLATWNIREFDSRAYGLRGIEPYHYIAEIISRFDLVALQEVRLDTAPLEKLRGLLGRWWNYLVTDVTGGTQGNSERMAFLYDSRKVRFGGLAGEVVIPPIETRDGNRKLVYTPSQQLARTPYVVGFQAGWFKFMLSTVHIVYGESRADDPKREREIREIADFMADRAREDHAWANNLILLGDFNIFAPDDVTFQALTDAGFTIPPGLQKVTNVGKEERFFDQMAFMTPNLARDQIIAAGAFDFYKVVYREADETLYIPDMGEAYDITSRGEPRGNKSLYYRTYWRTHQMSDHLPLWAALKVDFGREYLRSVAG
ncbi:endonuclease/exonuclease/phosphatase family protein [Maricaulis sp.]|uniref:endonuclease/exonuclease/phosphatase family protein n=1 Tax=Maricaulis sp. TaxID=1486257 RepID=UPI0026114E93|nr:endonuclease/exonuclease/phosphatase family protein [Maricaulis sp.]